MLPDYDKLICLFGYETNGGRESILWQQPSYFAHPTGQAGGQLDEAFAEWKTTKRDFTKEELLSGWWEKVSEWDKHYHVVFHTDGTLTEYDITNPGETWSGKWEFTFGYKQQYYPRKVVRLEIGFYTLDIFANKVGDSHSGIELYWHNSHTYQTTKSYFRVIHHPKQSLLQRLLS